MQIFGITYLFQFPHKKYNTINCSKFWNECKKCNGSGTSCTYSGGLRNLFSKVICHKFYDTWVGPPFLLPLLLSPPFLSNFYSYKYLISTHLLHYKFLEYRASSLCNLLKMPLSSSLKSTTIYQRTPNWKHKYYTSLKKN